MEILNLNTKDLNQNEYSINKLTKNKIGALYTFPINYTPNDCLSCEGYPIDFTPEDCLACDGYSLLIEDYLELYKIIGTKFNQPNL